MEGNVVGTSASFNPHDQCTPFEVKFTHSCKVNGSNVWVSPGENGPCRVCLLSEIRWCISHVSYLEIWCKSCKVLICSKIMYSKHKGCDTMHLEDIVEKIRNGRKVMDRVCSLSSKCDGAQQKLENMLEDMLANIKVLSDWKNRFPMSSEWNTEVMTLYRNLRIGEVMTELEQMDEMDARSVNMETEIQIINEYPFKSQEAQDSTRVNSASSASSRQDMESTENENSDSAYGMRISAPEETTSSSISRPEMENSTTNDTAYNSTSRPDVESSSLNDSALDSENSSPKGYTSSCPSRQDVDSSASVESRVGLTFMQDSITSVPNGSVASNVHSSHVDCPCLATADGPTSHSLDSLDNWDPTKRILTVNSLDSAESALPHIRNRSERIKEVCLLYKKEYFSEKHLEELLCSMKNLNCTVTVAVVDSLNSNHLFSGTTWGLEDSVFIDLRKISREVVEALKKSLPSKPWRCALGQFFGRLDKQTLKELPDSPLRIRVLGLSVHQRVDFAVVKEVLHKVDGNLAFQHKWSFLKELYFFISNEIDAKVWIFEEKNPRKQKKTRKTNQERKRNHTSVDTQSPLSDPSNEPTLNVYFVNINKKGINTMIAILKRLIQSHEENAVLRKLFFTYTSKAVFEKYITKSIADCNLPKLEITLL